jgi:hypothetical protein
MTMRILYWMADRAAFCPEVWHYESANGFHTDRVAGCHRYHRHPDGDPCSYAPSGQRARQRAACLSNLKQLTVTWILYADDNDNKIVHACTGKLGENPIPTNEDGWVHWAGYVDATTDQAQIRAVQEGALFPYCKTEKLYQCPTGLRGEMRTYSIVDSMNGWPSSGPHIKNRMQITRPGERVVFLDEGWVTFASWSIPYDTES